MVRAIRSNWTNVQTVPAYFAEMQVLLPGGLVSLLLADDSLKRIMIKSDKAVLLTDVV